MCINHGIWGWYLQPVSVETRCSVTTEINLPPLKSVSLDCHLTNVLDEQIYPNHANKKGNSKGDFTSTTLFVPLALFA